MSLPASLRFLCVAMFAAQFFILRLSAISDAQEASPEPAATPTPVATASPDRLHIGITPYLWVPTINSSLQFTHLALPPGSMATSQVGVRFGPNNYLSKLNSAVQVALDVGKGDSFFFGDVIYMNLSNTGATVVDLSGPLGHIHLPINADTSARLTMTLADAGIGGYFTHSSAGKAGAFVGLRYVDIDTSVAWNLTGPLGGFSRSGSATEKRTDLAGIAGLRGRAELGRGWFIPLYGDYGGSGDLETYQFLGGIGHAYPTGAVTLVWRQLAYFSNNSDPKFNIQNIHLGGPAFAWTFNL